MSSEIEQLAAQCAPSVDHKTLAYIVAHESSNRQYAINVNYGSPQLERQPTNPAEALEAIGSLEQAGHNFDIGVAQINSSNFEGLGVSAEELLDPCKNIGQGAVVLEDCYHRALRRNPDEQQALRMALSCYNTGSFERGFNNGYVSRIERVAAQDQVVPRLIVGQPGSNPDEQESSLIKQPIQQLAHPNDNESYIMSDVFSSAASDAFDTAPPGAFN
ncbi:lytic transglycosylase domain-containing protein [Halomonas sp. 3A7M]|uniref:lytic transglycosylase domain-containing protein n=1 Tax=Halomonas sp. 3A7M TaxID=2742616 RepID=UPI001867BD4D|nr:lytic transglycosylase domain-containing protein [Halomonas sp. 3A7M]